MLFGVKPVNGFKLNMCRHSTPDCGLYRSLMEVPSKLFTDLNGRRVDKGVLTSRY